ncbi:hypothetical protein BJ878DRAFT_125597 [Calycina marina]|uniref:Uncharacterized protein n=1 Tax=Calycina marina TaxID=1763456 RepID=A0A9P7Z1Q6_9HELO|nr:hypothetical protein BJ878DRAFT_125597 [Calycina marina]
MGEQKPMAISKVSRHEIRGGITLLLDERRLRTPSYWQNVVSSILWWLTARVTPMSITRRFSATASYKGYSERETNPKTRILQTASLDRSNMRMALRRRQKADVAAITILHSQSIEMLLVDYSNDARKHHNQNKHEVHPNNAKETASLRDRLSHTRTGIIKRQNQDKQRSWETSKVMLADSPRSHDRTTPSIMHCIQPSPCTSPFPAPRHCGGHAHTTLSVLVFAGCGNCLIRCRIVCGELACGGS